MRPQPDRRTTPQARPPRRGPIFRGRAVDPGTLGFDLPFERFASIAADAGFDQIEVPVGALEELGVTHLRHVATCCGLRTPVFSCPWASPANGSVDSELFIRRLDALPRILDNVAAAGGRLISAFFAGERPGMTRLSRDELVNRCGQLVTLAQQRGLGICVELNDAAVLRDAAKVVHDTMGLRLLFDTFHFFRAGLQPAWLGTLPLAAIGWVHLSDVPHGAVATLDGGPREWPGRGVQDFGPIADGLAHNGYTGPLSLEVLPPPTADHGRYAAALLAQTASTLANAGIIWADTGDSQPP